MNSDLFDLSLKHWSVLPLYVLPGVVNLGLFVYAQIFLSQNRINSTFSLFIFLLSVSQLCDGMMHMGNSENTAIMWQRMSVAPWLFTTPVGIFFALSFGKERFLNRSRLAAVLLTPATVLLLLVIGGMAQFEMIFKEGWGWIANPKATPFNFVVYGFITAGTVFVPALMWRYWTRSGKGTIERPKFLMLALGVSIPYAGGLISEVILPLLFDIDDVPLVGPLLTIFSIFSFIAIRKYNMLDYSPRSQWSQILETLREGVLIADNSLKIMYTNPALTKLLGYSSQEMLGREADKLILDISLRLKDAASGTEREFQMSTKSGNLIWVVINLSSCLNNNGKRIGTIWTITNIDDLKRKGLEIKRSEDRLNRAQEIAHVGHWDFDLRSGHAKWSAEACRIYGFSPEDQVHNYDEWISFVHPEDLNRVKGLLQRAESTMSDSDFEYRIILRDGTIKHLRSISKLEKDEHDSVTGLYGVCQDITEIKKAHEKVVRSTNELETYIYKSSHDMHAPLASILGLINVSRLEIFDPVAVTYLQMIESQAKKLDSVRADFIRAMNIKDAKKLDEEIHVNAMIGDILKDLRSKEGFSRIQIDVNVAPGKKLLSNKFLIRTILQNLIENSIKYQNYAEDRSLLRIDFQQADNTAKIIIEDNGVGIDPSIHDKIFDMYFRSSDSRNGSGLGLYLVKKAVEKLEGKLHLKSSPGQGTRVTLSFAQVN